MTDANLVLGRLASDRFLGGRMEIDGARAAAAIRPIAERLQLTCESAAEGIVRVVNASMERAIRSISVERGHDPREYVLIAFGGAAGQHACELGAALGIRQIVVPYQPGLLSAWGAAAADVQRDLVRTVRLSNPSMRRLQALFRPLERAAWASLREEAVSRQHCRLLRFVDVSYEGQSFEISLPFGERLAERFHAAHRRLYGYADLARPTVVVNLRLLAVGRGPRPRRPAFKPGAPAAACKHWVRWGNRRIAARLHMREQLPPRCVLEGPMVVAEFSATTFVPPGWTLRVHPAGHLLLSHGH